MCKDIYIHRNDSHIQLHMSIIVMQPGHAHINQQLEKKIKRKKRTRKNTTIQICVYRPFSTTTCVYIYISEILSTKCVIYFLQCEETVNILYSESKYIYIYINIIIIKGNYLETSERNAKYFKVNLLFVKEKENVHCTMD